MEGRAWIQGEVEEWEQILRRLGKVIEARVMGGMSLEATVGA